jgi:tetratricopeptide (TPR) repeat protein
LPSCTICRYEVADDSATVCPNCGAPIQHADSSADRIEQASPFSRSESKTEPPTSDGVSSPTSPVPSGDEDSLEICDPGEFLGAQKSTADSPAGPEEGGPDESGMMPGNAPTRNADRETGAADGEDMPSPKSPGIQKLSEEQINNIRSSMMKREGSDSEFATPEDASMILHNLRKSGDGPAMERQHEDSEPPPVSSSQSVPEPVESNLPETDTPPEAKPDPPRGVKTTPIRNIAYFHKNFIQLTGNVHPVAGEELRIDERAWVLRPKRIKPQYTITAFAILAAIFLFIIGKQFISPTVPGSGSIVGLILDNSGRPLAKGLQLRIPEIGKTAVSDAAGFFRFDGVETGTYIVEFTLPDGRVGQENVSVAANELTTVSMSTADAVVKSVAEVSSTSSTRQHKGSVTGRSPQASRSTDNVAETASTGGAVSAKMEYSDLRLRANVDNAKLIVNGQTLGRGNTTFRKLMPGTHSAKVVKDGYQTWKGKVNLKPGETYTLAVTLKKAETKSAEPEYTAEDFYQSGATMLAKGDAKSAIRDLTQAIKMDPSMADAYYKRAKANLQESKTILAESDYVRAGEIYRTQKRMSTSLDAFNRAIDINPKSVPALINRGDIYMQQDNKSAAMDDYHAAVNGDKDNFQANFKLGKAYFALGKYKDADKRLRKARDLDPSVPEVYHYLMLNYFARDDFKDVKKTYSDFKQSVNPNAVQAFKGNPRYDAILRVIGEYDSP